MKGYRGSSDAKTAIVPALTYFTWGLARGRRSDVGKSAILAGLPSSRRIRTCVQTMSHSARRGSSTVAFTTNGT